MSKAWNQNSKIEAARRGSRVSMARRLFQIAVVVTCLVGPNKVWAQASWPSYPNNSAISVTGTGMVGIGTASPTSLLEVNGDTTLKGMTFIHAPWAYIGMRSGSISNDSSLSMDGSGHLILDDSSGGQLILATGGSGRINILQNGNVGVGTTAPPYRLSVEGTIGAREVIVNNTTWADYVFQPGYNLQPLSEVSAYIQEHGHLPGIPSEEEVKTSGVSLGEMQAKLLAKVEELTLHVIRQERENEELRQRIAVQEAKNKLLLNAVTSPSGTDQVRNPSKEE